MFRNIFKNMSRGMLAVILLAKVSFCVNGDFFIEITPNNEPDSYQMRVGETATFYVTAYRKETTDNFPVNLEKKVWWQYDKRLFEKVSQDEISITLKAVNPNPAVLKATTTIKNEPCQKEINIFIK